MGYARQFGRILTVLILLFAVPVMSYSQAALQYNYTQAGTTGSTTRTVLSNVNTLGASLIVIGLTSFGAVAAPTLTDNIGTSYGPGQLAASVDAPSSGPRLRIYYIYGASIGSATHTFSCTTVGAGYSSIYVATYTGTAYLTNPLNQVATLSATGVLNATVTTTTDKEAVFAMSTSSTLGGAAPTMSGAFTLLNTNPFLSGGSFLGGSANLIKTPAGSATPAFNYSSANSAAATISFYSAAPSGNGGAWNLFMNQ